MSQPQEQAPTGLEYKSTEGLTSAERGGRDATFSLRSAPLPHQDRTGAALSDDERKSALAPVGSPAYGDSVSNSDVASLGAASGAETPIVDKAGVNQGLSTSSGGTQTRQAMGSAESGGTAAKAPRQSKKD